MIFWKFYCFYVPLGSLFCSVLRGFEMLAELYYGRLNILFLLFFSLFPLSSFIFLSLTTNGQNGNSLNFVTRYWEFYFIFFFFAIDRRIIREVAIWLNSVNFIFFMCCEILRILFLLILRTLCFLIVAKGCVESLFDWILWILGFFIVTEGE